MTSNQLSNQQQNNQMETKILSYMLPNTFIEKFFQTKRPRQISSQKQQNETSEKPLKKAKLYQKNGKQNKNQKQKDIIGYYKITSASSTSGEISAKLYTLGKEQEGILTRTNIQELQKTRSEKNW